MEPRMERVGHCCLVTPTDTTKQQRTPLENNKGTLAQIVYFDNSFIY
jgi:hypothetical protein